MPKHLSSLLSTNTFAAFIGALYLLGLPFFLDASINTEKDSTLIIANLLPIIAAWMITVAASGRILFSTGVIGIVVYLLFEISNLKEINIGQPLVFPDIYLIKQVATGWELFEQYAAYSPALILVPLTLAIAVFLFRRETPTSRRVRLALLFMPLAGAILLLSNQKLLDTFYSAYSHGSKPFAGAEKIREAQGLLASLATGARLALRPLPDFDKAAAEKTVAKARSRMSSGPSQEQPDIILWLAESFFDPSTLEGLEPCQALPALCELEQHAERFELKVPTYGGNTTRTEFEVLTGIPYRLLPSGSYAYETAVTSTFPSLVWELRTRGYSTLAIHPHVRTFWNRNRAYPLLGFQDFIGEHQLGAVERDGLWISDQTLTDKVIEQVSTGQAPPNFVFAISMEGHGPYRRHPVADEKAFAALSPTKALSDNAAAQWRSYLYHATNALSSLQTLLDFIAEREKPTLVVFFGDHLPGLHEVFKEWTFDNGKKAYQQRTPALVFSNYDLQLPDWRPGASYELGLWIHEATRLQGESRFAELATVTALRKSDKSAVSKDELKNLQIRLLH